MRLGKKLEDCKCKTRIYLIFIFIIFYNTKPVYVCVCVFARVWEFVCPACVDVV